MLVAAGLTVFVGVEGPDLARALALIPTSSFFDDNFGARTLPRGLAQIFGVESEYGKYGEVLLGIGSLTAGLRLGLHTKAKVSLELLTDREQVFFCTGALLTVAAFFTAQNIGYRAIHLILVVPALAAVWRVGVARSISSLTLGAVLIVLWAEGWRHSVDRLFAFPVPYYQAAHMGRLRLPLWLLREASWWWTVTLLIAALVALLVRPGTAGSAVLAWLGRQLIKILPRRGAA